jgi:hypothetical protein
MLQNFKLTVWSTVVASANFGQPGASDYSAFVALAFTVLRAVALALQQSLPVLSNQRAGCLAAPRYVLTPLPSTAPLKATPDIQEIRNVQS